MGFTRRFASRADSDNVEGEGGEEVPTLSARIEEKQKRLETRATRPCSTSKVYSTLNHSDVERAEELRQHKLHAKICIFLCTVLPFLTLVATVHRLWYIGMINFEDVADCPDEWIMWSGSCYFYMPHPQPWSHAHSTCSRLESSHLVDIVTDEENQFLEKMTSSRIWIGGKYSSQGWSWEPGGWRLNTTNIQNLKRRSKTKPSEDSFQRVKDSEVRPGIGTPPPLSSQSTESVVLDAMVSSESTAGTKYHSTSVSKASLESSSTSAMSDGTRTDAFDSSTQSSELFQTSKFLDKMQAVALRTIAQVSEVTTSQEGFSQNPKTNSFLQDELSQNSHTSPVVSQDVQSKNSFTTSNSPDVQSKDSFTISNSQDVYIENSFSTPNSQDVQITNSFTTSNSQNVQSKNSFSTPNSQDVKITNSFITYNSQNVQSKNFFSTPNSLNVHSENSFSTPDSLNIHSKNSFSTPNSYSVHSKNSFSTPSSYSVPSKNSFSTPDSQTVEGKHPDTTHVTGPSAFLSTDAFEEESGVHQNHGRVLKTNRQGFSKHIDLEECLSFQRGSWIKEECSKKRGFVCKISKSPGIKREKVVCRSRQEVNLYNRNLYYICQD